MKFVRFLALMLIMSALTACGGGSSGISASIDTDSSAPADVTYSGSAVTSSTGSDGKTVIASSSSGRTYEVTVVDGSGNPVEGLEVVFYEDGDDAFIYISDPDGAYSDVVIIGEPDEIDADRARAAGDVGLGLEMGAGGASTVGFTQDAVNLPYVFVSKQGKNEGNWETGCYTLEDIASRFYDKYDAETDIDDVYSVLSFYGTGADTDTRYLKFKSAYMSNSGARSGKGVVEEDSRPDMTSALTDRMEHVFGTDGGYFGEEVFRLSCYYPDNTDNFYAICEISRDTSTCATQNRHSLEGTPSPTVVVNNYYAFTPKVDDTDHSTITYSITNKPDWADFDTVTGKIYGTPTSTGTDSDITITGTDGSYSTSIGPFNITIISPVIGKTAQTTTYVNYDDGYYETGKALSFTTSNAITDNVTGLRWSYIYPEDTTYTYAQAASFCSTYTDLDGISGYRLPTVKELSTHLYYAYPDNGEGNVLLPSQYYLIAPHTYWTSTQEDNFGLYYWAINFGTGEITVSGTAVPKYVRCVKGDAETAADFTRNPADNTVTDNNTGLMWLDDSSVNSGLWADAVAECAGKTAGGFTDWRLPNIREMMTIADYSETYAVNTVFESDAHDFYYTSTTVPSDTTAAYAYNTSSGYVSAVIKTLNEKYIRCVRGGLIIPD